MSQCTRVKEKLQRVEKEASFKHAVDHTLRSLLQPYYINQHVPEKVRIPSKDKLDRQVAYLSNKVWKAESKKEELYFHEATKKNIGALVESSMSQFTPLIEK